MTPPTYTGLSRGAPNQQQQQQQQSQYEHYPRNSYPQSQAQYLDQYNLKENQKKSNQLVPLSVSADR